MWIHRLPTLLRLAKMGQQPSRFPHLRRQRYQHVWKRRLQEAQRDLHTRSQSLRNQPPTREWRRLRNIRPLQILDREPGTPLPSSDRRAHKPQSGRPRLQPTLPPSRHQRGRKPRLDQRQRCRGPDQKQQRPILVHNEHARRFPRRLSRRPHGGPLHQRRGSRR